MKNVLIIGATSDVAQSLSNLFLPPDYKLYLAGRRIQRLKPLKAHLKTVFAADAELIEMDVCETGSHPALFDPLAGRIDILICLAGYLGDQKKAQSDFNEAAKIIATNFTGLVSIINLFAGHFEERGHGLIVGVSSVAGERGRQSNYIYGAAKAGFSTYLDGLRNRLHPAGVHVITVKPGFMDTKMTAGLNLPKPLTAQPEQAARLIAKAIDKRKNTVYILPVWRWVMLVIRNIPEFIFKKLSL